MALKIKSQILDNILSTLKTITLATGYTLNVQNVETVARPIEKFTAQERLSSILVVFSGEDKGFQSESPYANDQERTAIAQYKLFVSMDNVEQGIFLDFLEDIEAVLTKDESRGGLCGDYFIVQRTWVDSIDMVETEEENINRIWEALVTVNVSYNYIPYMLSGSSDRTG